MGLRRLVTGGDDGAVRVWNIDDGEKQTHSGAREEGAVGGHRGTGRRAGQIGHSSRLRERTVEMMGQMRWLIGQNGH